MVLNAGTGIWASYLGRSAHAGRSRVGIAARLRVRILAAPAAMLLLLLALACGGGGGGGTPAATPPPGGTPPSASQVATTLSAVQTSLDPLLTADSPDISKVQAALGAVSGITATAVSGDGQCVMARYGDSGPVIFVSLADPEGSFTPSDSILLQAQAAVQRARPQTANTNLPKGTNVLLLNGLGGSTYKDVTPGIKNIFASYYAGNNYTINVQQASLANLMAVKAASPDVLFIKTHGARSSNLVPLKDVSGNTLPMFSLASSDRVDPANAIPDAYKYDIAVSNNIVYLYEATDKNKFEWLFGITQGFVAKYWSMNAGGFAFVSACSSTSPEAGGFVDAVCALGASYYIGWSAPIDTDFADDRCQYLFDRLLGSNTYTNNSPPQRAFDLMAVFQDMTSNNMVTWPGSSNPSLGPSTLSLFPGNSNDFGLLAPTISYVSINEQNSTSQTPTLTINGEFGDTPGTVQLNGNPLGNVTWGAKKITCDLPTDQAGELTVLVNNIQSNTRRITKYTGTFTYTCQQDPSQSVPKQLSCSLNDTVTFKLVFRGDFDTYRNASGVAPADRVVNVTPTRDSTTQFTCTGSQVLSSDQGPIVMWQWSGGGNQGVDNASDASLSYCFILYDTVLKRFTFDIHLLGYQGSKTETYTPGLPGSYSVPDRIATFNPQINSAIYDFVDVPNAHYDVYITQDGSWNIPSAKRQTSVNTAFMLGATQYTLEWTAFNASYPPVEDKTHGK